ncbi:MAG: iron ABC transporter permease [Spirochaetes bacterium]|uniref:Iron ABC transporter permease n=1 Tax=Candidatus Ornithospirochaeta stercoravium TaxID=2840897 RepID=A0A9D9NCS2_9SPIO|nr:iron ABC transporter permease [Candidatus Ornithospirochaeta stercoravium]
MGKKISSAIVILLLVLLIICPLLSIFREAAFTEGRFNLSGAIATIAESENAEMIASSLLLGILVVIVSSLIALPLAYIFSRTEFAKYRFFDIIFMIPFMTPPYIASMGWILFMQKRGLMQQLFPSLAFISDWFFSLGGLVLVMSFHVFPFMMTMMKNAMLSVPSSLDEAGAVLGARFLLRIRKLFMPLLTGNYAIGALLVFVKTISEYGTPSTLGRRIGFEVFTTDIHRYATVAPIEFGKSASLASVLIGICIFIWLLQNYITNRRSYSLVGSRPGSVRIGKMRRLPYILCWIFIILVIFFTMVIPLFSVTASSLIKLRGYGLRAGNFTFDNYVKVFTEDKQGTGALLVSIFLAVSSATIASVLGTLSVLASRKAGKRTGRVIEGLSLIPEMLPSIVLVLGIMLFYNGIYRLVPIYGTIWIMVLSYVILFLPYTVQYVTSSFSQIGSSLVAAGRICGGSPSYVFIHVTFPLIFRGILSGWMMTFIIAFRELVTPSLIAPTNTLTVSTYINRQFEQGSVGKGMAMAVICILFSTVSLLLLNKAVAMQKK